MRFSRTLAILFGVLAPVAETIRRWHTWRQYPPGLFDDYVMGAFLLTAAFLVRHRFYLGQKLLAAAWGFACGLGYYSFFEQLRRYRLGEMDPGPLPTNVILLIKAIGVLLAIAALVATVRARSPRDD
jgi:hypothetical protein